MKFNSGPLGLNFFSNFFSLKKHSLRGSTIYECICNFSFSEDVVFLSFNKIININNEFVALFLDTCSSLIHKDYVFNEFFVFNSKTTNNVLFFNSTNDFNVCTFLTTTNKDLILFNEYGLSEAFLSFLFCVISDAGLHTFCDPSILFKFDLCCFKDYCLKNNIQFNLFSFLRLLCVASCGITESHLKRELFYNLRSDVEFLRTRFLLYQSETYPSSVSEFIDFNF